jgi:hypothetical protein
VTDSIYALLAGALAPVIGRGSGPWIRRAGGGIFLGLGALAALTGARTNR